jgi:anthranilate synthase/aminodeoxychorismate synthase-like glutamine amidotransferase
LIPDTHLILLIDNYDSFTYNLYDYFCRLQAEVRVIRNDHYKLPDIIAMQPSALVISPGPGRPIDSGITMELIEYYHDKLPILGICLGHQALGEFFGARLIKSPYPMHGKTSLVHHEGNAIFADIPVQFEVMRYHSLELESLTGTPLQEIASADGTIMALKHNTLPLYGLQFHPESILTPDGLKLLENWLKLIDAFIPVN